MYGGGGIHFILNFSFIVLFLICLSYKNVVLLGEQTNPFSMKYFKYLRNKGGFYSWLLSYMCVCAAESYVKNEKIDTNFSY